MLSTLALVTSCAGFLNIGAPNGHAGIGWTQADILNLRDRPTAQAKIIAKLRMNTMVHEEQRQGAWSRVRVAERPVNHPIRGWLKRSFIAPKKVSWQYALKRSANASDVVQKRQWAERAVALHGGRSESWNQLAKALTEVGDEAGLTRVRRHREGRDDIYFAACRHGRVALIGRLRPGEGFLSLGSVASPQQQNGAVEALNGAAWFEFGSIEESVPVEGSPFTSPFLTPYYNEEGSSAYLPGTCRGELCSDARVVILGPCGGAARFLVTFPLRAVALEQTSIGKAADTLGALAKVRPRAPLGFLGVASVAGTPWTQVTVNSKDRDQAEVRSVTSWALMEGVRSMKLLGHAWGSKLSKPQELPFASVRLIAWLQGTIDRVATFIVVHEANWRQESGWAITVIPSGKPATTHRVSLEAWGC